ncbi:serine/threonine-protein kinase [Dactylosporangium cerinum]|uniref:non-specific serine/threonine protein kinase n=1 Tax=Dactylosporangium cerinum TaxID=1434730 RepID=A0ABV9VKK2_9ACTN
MVEQQKLLSGRYRLIEPIGEGGMSVVWRAYDEVLRRRVAVKLLTTRLPDAGRLRAEAQAAALLSHPNVSAVYDYGVTDDEPFVVMELLDGETLSARLTRGPLPWRAAVEVCAHIAAALSAAHARGLVHRDIKPGNIMLTDTGVKVVDFGIAALAGSRVRRALGRGTGGPAADVYALGVVLFTSLTGRRPANRGEGLLRGDPGPTPLPLIPGMPLQVAALYQDCVAAEPLLRPSAATLARQFAALSGVRVGAVDNDPPPSATDPRTLTGTAELFPIPPRRDGRGRRVAVKVTVAAVLAAATGVAVAVAVAGQAGPAVSGGSWRPGGSDPAARPTAPAADASPSDTSVAPTCSVTYQVKDTWDRGASVSLSIANTGGTDVRQWALQFDLPDGLQVRDGWNGVWQQQGQRVDVAALPGHPDLAAGASVHDVGTTIDGSGAAGIPDSFLLNGVHCRTTAQP